MKIIIALLLLTLPAMASKKPAYSYHPQTRTAQPHYTKPRVSRGSYGGSTHKNGHYTSPNRRSR